MTAGRRENEPDGCIAENTPKAFWPDDLPFDEAVACALVGGQRSWDWGGSDVAIKHSVDLLDSNV